MKQLQLPLRQLGWIVIKQIIYNQFPTVPQLNTEALAHWLEKPEANLQLIDTRNAEEFAISHLPQAQHIPNLGLAEKVHGLV